MAVVAGCGGSDDSPPPLSSGAGGSGGAGGQSAGVVASGPSRGSAIALTEDDSIAVAVNRDVGSVSVFSVNYSSGAPQMTRTAEVPVGAEPWELALHPDGDTAFVVLRRDQKLVKITGLKSTPTVAGSVATGSEPTGVALTPSGATAWVANWVDGTVLGVDTATMAVTSTIDLNKALAASGYLGAVEPRPALAHPRALTITNKNGKDDDQTLLVTEFFSQQKEPLAADGSNADTNRVGVVYRVALSDLSVAVVELPAVADMGFKDHNGGTAGCYPNQVTAITTRDAFAYAVSTCASPRGPVGTYTGPAFASCSDDSKCPGAVPGSCVAGKCTTNCTTPTECGANGGVCSANKCTINFADVKTTTAPVVSVIDLLKKCAGPAPCTGAVLATVNLNFEMDKQFETGGTLEDARAFPLMPTDIGFTYGGTELVAFLPANGSDSVFRVKFDETYQADAIKAVGWGNKNPFVSLGGGASPGQLPIGVAVAHKPRPDDMGATYGFVANDATRNVTALDLDTGKVVSAASSADLPADPLAKMVLEGRRLFQTGLGRWSMDQQGWSACQSCHTDGLSDGVTWYFGRGPRQSLSLEGTFSANGAQQRVLNWTAPFDEVTDLESVVRSTMGGVGLIVKEASFSTASRLPYESLGQSGLSGSAAAAADSSNPGNLPAACVIDDWAKVVEYAKTVRSPRAPTNLDPAKVTEGRGLFQAGKCQGCHSGDQWTTSHLFYTPDPTNKVNNSLKTTSWGATVAKSGLPMAVWPAVDAPAQMMRYSGSNPGPNDQLTCILRNVGTYGVGEAGPVPELKQDMTGAGQGNDADGRGFNPPSLLGAATGAPFFHAGNARTLEGALSASFAQHHGSLASGFLPESDGARAANVAALVQFLLSIDESAQPIAIPALGPEGGVFCSTP
ncbi:MAG: hypothetical protein IT374_08460 [Polyangiaceae bacterium]|nr:hypothetical protein [Polyangiaceae bacterium]